MTREGLATEFKSVAKASGKSRLSPSKRSLDCYATDPEGGRSDTPRPERATFLHECLKNWITRWGKTKRFVAELASIHPDRIRALRDQKKKNFTAKKARPPAVSRPVSRRPQPEVTTLFELPTAPARLVGRGNEIYRLCAEIRDRSLNALSIWGMAGVGKTAFALTMAHALRSHYPDGALYLDMLGEREDTEPLKDLDAMLHALRAFEIRLPTKAERVAGAYRSLLDKKRLLFLLDNVAPDKHVESLLPPKHCLLLLTSRSNLSIPRVSAHSLLALPAHDSVSLVKDLAPRAADFASRIAELCGHLPLALVLAANWLEDNNTFSPQGLINQLISRCKVLTEADTALGISQVARDKILIDVDAALEVSYNALTDDLRSRCAMLGIFSGSWDADAVRTVWKLPIAETRESLQVLVNRCFVEWNGNAQRYRLHDLVRVFLVNKLDREEQQKARDSHAIHYGVSFAAYSKSIQRIGIKPVLSWFDTERHNIVQGHRWCASVNPYHPFHGQKILMSYGEVADELLDLRFSVDDQVEWWQPILDAAALENNDDIAHAAMQALSRANTRLLKAGELRKAASIANVDKDLLDDDDERRHSTDLLTPLSWADPLALGPLKEHWRHLIGQIHRCAGEAKRGEQEEVEKSLEEISRLVESHTEAGSIEEADCFSGIATHLRCCKQPQLAIRTYERSERVCSNLEGPVARECEVVLLSHIARCYADLRNLEGVRSSLNKALQKITDDRMDLRAEILTIMAELFHNLGQSSEALIAAEAAMPILRELNSPKASELLRLVRAMKASQSATPPRESEERS